MADDNDNIDIEEHDVLDNPAIRNMFPDIAALKQEIENFGEGSEDCAWSAKEQQKKNEVTTNLSNCMVASAQSDNEEQTIKTERIIVDLTTDLTETYDKSFIGNKIILGSKPSAPLQYDEEFFEKQVINYNVNVFLDDLKPYLQSSGRFCQECLILFPSKTALNAHNDCTHINKSLSMPAKKIKSKSGDSVSAKVFQCTECSIRFGWKGSLKRHNVKFHCKKNQTQRSKIHKMILKVKDNIKDNSKSNVNKSNECFHCKKLFATQQSLVEHLYNVLESKKYLCKLCSEKFTNKLEYNKHIASHEKCVVRLNNIANQLKNRTTVSSLDDLSIKVKRTSTLRNKKDADTHLKSETNNLGEFNTDGYYRCYICGYYFTQSKFCISHLANKHNVNSENNLKKKEFDSVCKHCNKDYSSMHSYNNHLIKDHKEQVHFKGIEKDNRFSFGNQTTPLPTASKQNNHTKNNNMIEMIDTPDDLLVLKSVLFKCSKCDIHFLTSKLARNHADHMEMLINWKCSLCNRIFKKVDQIVHEKQHILSQSFNVHELCPAMSTPVLYNCVKCTVHFDENCFLQHQLMCKSKAPHSVYCIICDILIDASISNSHRSEHVSKSLKASDFIIIDSEILPICGHNEGKSKELLGKNAESPSSPKKAKCDTLKIKINKSPITNSTDNKEKQFDQLLSLTYCDTCSCYLTGKYKREVHVAKQCGHIAKHVCEICGLILTPKTMQTTHKNIHNTKDVTLKDFRFYDLRSGKQISPPIPEYPKCLHCEVYFTSKAAISSHICSETSYLTCHLCDTKLTDNAFKLHMLFHNYSKPNVEFKVDHKRDIISTKMELQTKGPRMSIPSDIRNREKQNSSVKTIEAQSQPKVTASNKFGSNTIGKSNKSFKTSHIKSLANNQSEPQKQIVRPSELQDTKSIQNIHIPEIVYQCKNCHVSVDTYDKVVEHCQDHYCNEEETVQTEVCLVCDIVFDRACYENHKKLHGTNNKKVSFTLLSFDVFFFTSESKIWIEHVFATLSQEQKDKIINESIYKFECRIKMDVIQEGPPDLTVYKCDKCRSFIDEFGLYKHAENSCFKVRKHPCSVCGLPFNSSVSRIKHEDVHKSPNINFKSYRIVTFNKEEDKSLNKMLYCRSQYYVLYQCRNCSVAVDKSQTSNHKCSERNSKECKTCGLLLFNDDYDNHISRHTKLPKFIQKNIKIILFGETISNSKHEMGSSFTGIVYDYTFYSCSKCQICFKTDANLENHICSFGANRLKCSKCKLYFVTSKLKQHVKLHETDLDFVRENMRIIMFNREEEISTNTEVGLAVVECTESATSSVDSLNSQLQTDDKCVASTTSANVKVVDDKSNSKTNVSQDTNTKAGCNAIEIESSLKTQNSEQIRGSQKEEKHAKLYKCFCGLHFLDRLSVLAHFKNCDPKLRTAKQTCAKCSLLFTANVLFTHLIMHHGNKTDNYNFKVFDLAGQNVVYQCSKCTLHFPTLNDIGTHLKACDGVIGSDGALEGKDCIFCNLKFESASFVSHDCNNVNNFDAGYEVIELDEFPVSYQNLIKVSENTVEKTQEIPNKDLSESEMSASIDVVSSSGDADTQGASKPFRWWKRRNRYQNLRFIRPTYYHNRPPYFRPNYPPPARPPWQHDRYYY